MERPPLHPFVEAVKELRSKGLREGCLFVWHRNVRVVAGEQTKSSDSGTLLTISSAAQYRYAVPNVTGTTLVL
jgi:hypothetical protein